MSNNSRVTAAYVSHKLSVLLLFLLTKKVDVVILSFLLVSYTYTYE